jgi:hypothetical protein
MAAYDVTIVSLYRQTVSPQMKKTSISHKTFEYQLRRYDSEN